MSDVEDEYVDEEEQEEEDEQEESQVGDEGRYIRITCPSCNSNRFR